MTGVEHMTKFSIIIPTWKNLEYLDLCYRGILRNSAVAHEVIVFFNEYDDQCGRWTTGKDILFDRSPDNLGVCGAVNRATKLASSTHVCFMNDDMYPLPGWDTALSRYIDGVDKLWLSGTALEAGRAAECYIGGCDYGKTPGEFQEEKLLKEFGSLKRSYNMVSTWTPILLSRADWDAIGGFDESYFPGDGSDPDLAMKMYQYGCRHFIGVGDSLVYHFSRRTIGRFDDHKMMDPKAYFEKKWGMTWRRFLKKVIHRDEIISDDLLVKMARSRVSGTEKK
jgi:GT2 family glycosyltransferase